MSMSSARGGSSRPVSYQRSYSSSSSSGSAGFSSENLPPRTLARVAREVRDLHKKPPEGVRLVVDAESGVPCSLGEVVAEVEGPTGTPYESRYFQLKLVLSSDFPASPPRGFFLTKIYHPNVDMSSGAICVNTLKKDWTSATTFSHVLSVIRCLMIVPFPESSLNDEAGKLFMDSYEEYARRAKLMANVHGRPRPFTDDGGAVANGSEGRGNTNKKGSDEDEGEGVDENVVGGRLKRGSNSSSYSSSSQRPQRAERSITTGSIRTSGSRNTFVSVGRSDRSLRVGGNTTEKKSKKKSLKRL